MLGDALGSFWGKNTTTDVGYRWKSVTIIEPTLFALHQAVDRQIFAIKKQIHQIVVGYRDATEELPQDYELEIDPSILKIDGLGFEICDDLTVWRENLGPGDKFEIRYSSTGSQWHRYEITSIDKLNYAGQELEYQIRTTCGVDVQRDAVDIYPLGSQGFRHLVKATDTLRCKTTPASNFQRVDRVRSVLHNFRTQQMLVVWESDGVTQVLTYADVFGSARPNDLP